MSDKIEEIRRKLPDVGFYTETGVDYQHLLAEVDRLRAEIERLRSQVEAVNLLKAEITLLRKALEPLARHYLWPDDLGEDMARLIRSDDDWSEEANEDADSDVFIKRKYIRAARHALKGK
jgi:hypothetical protein